MQKIILLTLLLTMAGCTSLIKPSLTFPENLNVIQLSDGGVCLDYESAKALAVFKAQYEAL